MAKTTSAPSPEEPQGSDASVPIVVKTPQQQLSESRFLALRPESDLKEVIAANYQEGESFRLSDLIRAKVPSGGATKWTLEELEGETNYDSITGVVVYYKPHGALWPSEEQKEGTKPFLVTTDLRVAEQFGDDWGDLNPELIEPCRILTDDGTPAVSASGRPLYNWKDLPYNQFGTAKGGKGAGKRCKESRLICILREDDIFPVFLRVPSGSLATVSSFVRKLTAPHYACVVEFSLSKEKSSEGIAYAQIKPRLVAKLSKTEAEFIRSTYTAKLEEAMNTASVEVDDSEPSDDDAPF